MSIRWLGIPFAGLTVFWAYITYEQFVGRNYAQGAGCLGLTITIAMAMMYLLIEGD